LNLIKKWEVKEEINIVKEDLREYNLKKVSFARNAIKSNLFSEDQITEICKWLDFHDTAFRDKKSKDKLKDYLLSKKYWKNWMTLQR
jgi:hypothetical protein